MYHPQIAVQTPHQYQSPSHDPHLWQGSKCYQKDTPETCERVPRSQEIPLGLGGRLEKEDRVEIRS